MENVELMGEMLDKGEEFYQKYFKDKFEKDHFGEIVAIEPISGDYFFDKRVIEAVKKAAT